MSNAFSLSRPLLILLYMVKDCVSRTCQKKPDSLYFHVTLYIYNNLELPINLATSAAVLMQHAGVCHMNTTGNVLLALLPENIAVLARQYKSATNMSRFVSQRSNPLFLASIELSFQVFYCTWRNTAVGQVV